MRTEAEVRKVLAALEHSLSHCPRLARPFLMREIVALSWVLGIEKVPATGPGSYGELVQLYEDEQAGKLTLLNEAEGKPN